MSRARKARRGFTLIELLITISIIALMASMILFALYSAQETAKVAKTKTLIAKLDAIVKARWDSYRTRRVPVVIPAGMPPPAAAKARLDGLRDLMRMEMPDRWSDISYLNTTTNRVDASSAAYAAMPAAVPPSSIWQGYFRKVRAANQLSSGLNPSLDYQGAECLYMIVMSAIAEEGDAREVFKPDDVKDVDGDGFPEFVDAWGRPIRFLRWAPGFQNSELQIVARVAATTPMPPTMPPTVNVSGPGLSSVPGSYIGGAIMGTTGPSNSLDCGNMGRITAYQSTGLNSATITYAFPPMGTPPSFSGNVVITNPDPFDPSGVYASTGPPADAPPLAIYPLIYSAGPDKAYGIISDASPPLAYAPAPGAPATYSPTFASLNPFVIFTVAGNPAELIGNARDIPAEPNFVSNAWLDNIHNHMLGTK